MNCEHEKSISYTEDGTRYEGCLECGRIKPLQATKYLKHISRSVAARKTGQGWDDYSVLTYANRKQAYAKQTELGDNWEVIRFGRPFLVAWKVGAPL